MYCQNVEQVGGAELQGEASRAEVECLEKLRFIPPFPPSPGWAAGVGPSLHLSFPAASPQPAAQVPATSAQGTACPPPPPPLGRWSTTQHMPPRADVPVPGSSLRGSRRARLMCDETESSEPLRGLGSKVGRGGGDDGYQKI